MHDTLSNLWLLQTLVSVSTVGVMDKMSDKDLTKAVLKELKEWFGPEVTTWQFLRCYRIPYAQPNQVQLLPLQAGCQLVTVRV